MKNLIYTILFLSLILLTIGSCNDSISDGGASSEPTLKNVADILNIQQGAALEYRTILEETDDTLAALEAMGQWIGEQPDVEDAWYHDLESVEIQYKNGLKSWIHLVSTDEDGIHETRGGGAPGALRNFSLNTEAAVSNIEEIKNKKVLILIPYTQELGYTSFRIESLRENLKKGSMEADIFTDDQVTLDVFNNVGDYGLIILDTHGQKHGFLMGNYSNTFELTDIWFPEDVKSKILAPLKIPEEKIASGEIEILQRIDHNTQTGKVSFSISVIVTENYVRNLKVDLSDAVVFGNHCYSGHTADGPNKNNMPEAWRSKGVAAYYGYAYDNGVSKPVMNNFAIAMEQVLLNGLVGDVDTTGVAHLNPDGLRYSFEAFGAWSHFRAPKSVKLTPLKGEEKIRQPFYFNHYYQTNYSYDTCGIFTDPRLGEKYKLACIGDQIWFAENLKYLADERKVPEGKDPAVYGFLYDYNTATAGGAVWTEGSAPIQGICPTGWHVPHRDDWKTLLKELGSETDVFFRANPDSIKKTIVRLAADDPNLDNYSSYRDDPELNQSGFSALATGYGAENEIDRSYFYVDSGSPTFWSSAPLAQNFKLAEDGEKIPTGNYDTESRWHVELQMNQRIIAYYIVHPSISDYYHPIRCVKD